MNYYENELQKYEIVKARYEEGLFTTEQWRAYCETELENLMKKNKEVLDRLKNI